MNECNDGSTFELQLHELVRIPSGDTIAATLTVHLEVKYQALVALIWANSA